MNVRPVIQTGRQQLIDKREDKWEREIGPPENKKNNYQEVKKLHKLFKPCEVLCVKNTIIHSSMNHTAGRSKAQQVAAE